MATPICNGTLTLPYQEGQYISLPLGCEGAYAGFDQQDMVEMRQCQSRVQP